MVKLDVKVKHFFKYLTITSGEDLQDLLIDMGYPIGFMNEEELKEATHFFTRTRFVQYDSGKHDNIKKFDFILDSDLIYFEFLKLGLVKTPYDLQEMDYFTFNLVFNNIGNSLQDRVTLRGQKRQSTSGVKDDKQITSINRANKELTIRQKNIDININSKLF